MTTQLPGTCAKSMQVEQQGLPKQASLPAGAGPTCSCSAMACGVKGVLSPSHSPLGISDRRPQASSRPKQARR